MGELTDRATRAAQLWGQGLVTARELIDFLDADDIPTAAQAGRDWWKAYTLGFVNLRRHVEITDPGWRYALRIAEGKTA